LHLQKAYESLGYKQGDFPVTERVAEEIVSLPMFPQMTNKQLTEVAAKARDFVTTNVSAGQSK
jgi:dTDP-4-amino-4,6-dideoxygalactose transaminase